MNNIIVGMGEALWDVLPEGKKIGGAPANFAYHVSQFGFDSRVVSAVGKDELGDEILNVFNEKKLKTQIEQVEGRYSPASPTDRGLPLHNWRQCLPGQQIPWQRSKASPGLVWKGKSFYCFPLFYLLYDEFCFHKAGSTQPYGNVHVSPLYCWCISRFLLC
jgi:hypothetical protein